MTSGLQQAIDAAWEERDSIGPDTRGEVRTAVDAAIAALDKGEARIAVVPFDATAPSCRFLRLRPRSSDG